MTRAKEDTPCLTATSDGVLYDRAADVWRIPAPGGPVLFDFNSLRSASPSLRKEAKHAMQAALAQSPARSVHDDFEAIRSMLRGTTTENAPVDAITPGLLQTYNARLPPGRRHLLARLANALRRWHASGAVGLSPDVLNWLAQLRPGTHDAGRAVRTLCAEQGALTEAQRDALLAALHRATAASTVSAADYAMALLVIVLALRPLQVACLKVGDLRPPSDPDMFAADLLVTRLKQRGGSRPRSAFTARGLTKVLAGVVKTQCARAADRALILGVGAPDCPLSPSARIGRTPPGFRGHMSGAAVGHWVGLALSRLDIPPEHRAEGRVFPLRLRRTYATLLSTGGCRTAEVSSLLDHTGPQMAEAYIEASPAPARRLAQALDTALEDIAASFGINPSAGTGAVPALQGKG